MISLNNGSYYTDNYLSIMIIGNIFGFLVMFLEMVGFGGYRPIWPAFSISKREKNWIEKGEPSVPLNPSFHIWYLDTLYILVSKWFDYTLNHFSLSSIFVDYWEKGNPYPLLHIRNEFYCIVWRVYGFHYSRVWIPCLIIEFSTIYVGISFFS